MDGCQRVISGTTVMRKSAFVAQMKPGPLGEELRDQDRESLDLLDSTMIFFLSVYGNSSVRTEDSKA